jgi:hypothetical protein
MNSFSIIFEFGPARFHRISAKCAEFVNPACNYLMKSFSFIFVEGMLSPLY